MRESFTGKPRLSTALKMLPNVDNAEARELLSAYFNKAGTPENQAHTSLIALTDLEESSLLEALDSKNATRLTIVATRALIKLYESGVLTKGKGCVGEIPEALLSFIYSADKMTEPEYTRLDLIFFDKVGDSVDTITMVIGEDTVTRECINLLDKEYQGVRNPRQYKFTTQKAVISE